jgi:MSHA biogenesis protein MshP
MCHNFYVKPTAKQNKIHLCDVFWPCKKRNTSHIAKNHGSALVIAIFVIIVMSLLGATLVKILASSQQNVVYEVLGTRAFAAAQSGIQWQLSQIFPLNTSGGTACAAQNDIDINTPIYNNVKGLAQCSVSVQCTDFVIDSIRYYTVNATAECEAASGILTSRTIEVEARSLP